MGAISYRHVMDGNVVRRCGVAKLPHRFELSCDDKGKVAMSSRITLVLAVLFLLGALIAGYLGIAVSKPAEVPAVVNTSAPPVAIEQPAQTPATPPVEEALRHNVVVLARDIPAYTPITAEDLVIERLKVAPPGSFERIEILVGRSSWRTLTAGTWPSESSFDAGGTLARMIRPHERALALQVDEVTGASGQLSPGDYVDVLLYLPEDASNPSRSSQVVVPALRILGIGGLLGPDRDGKPVQNISADERFKQEQQRINARTVTVAVPEALLARLMLASQTGILRLAVRSAEEGNLQDYWAGETGSRDAAERLDSANRQLVSFRQLSLSATNTATPGTAGRTQRAVEVIRGNQITQQTP
ncbi:Flp pilus assembly protein CpaB [Pseudomonas avellanae]|uniref:Flp pilus assembly protein CpaB n=3 Tax=Pseudomonas syringae group TaxID=136849 RepID=A0A2G9KV43_PSESF|nr:Flp pilus assembly protein CpaB [Pseudomonas syringae pv. actinidiae ICMP 9853]ATV16290.1 Flp pilus assembly protein CpaB [Pseudomonas syringae pv. actinidiae]EGH63699.1 Flp pilus assembly protein CpaB [Pseudomonas syringae pv. actinidiae str. M302091]EPM44709.1 Flp pilus assembly protein CpaB [Pseudomonas syringae pv. actinidiae ICMP 19103]EPM45587.1 Flp pilus assembly protein CpaB [Pseudomonas syringae pv. actinidiae ICMP 19073]EPM80856.1 Flp pilus assembly protein CpaB [Pseudomonas syrin